MSLKSCISKAGPLLSQENREQLYELADRYQGAGLSQAKAEKLAVRALKQQLQELKDQIEEGGGDGVLLSPGRGQDPAIGDRTDVSKLPKGGAIPESVSVGSLEESLTLARAKTYARGRDLKMDLQERVRAAAKDARVDLTKRTQALHRFLSDMVVADARFALKSNENAVGWYDTKVSRALGALSTVHPEIESDPKARLAFLWALATTSNGLKVDMNFKLAEKAYRTWKQTGKMPGDVGIGNAASAINDTLEMFNDLVVKLGPDRLSKFVSTQFTAGQIERMLGYTVGGEWKPTPVRGAALLGAKIGNGFFSNLNGYFDALTMDRWLMRTWGRMTGTLVEVVKAEVDKSRSGLKDKISALTDAERRVLAKLVDAPVRKDLTRAELDALAHASQKASMKKDKREVMMSTGGMNSFRKAANNHHGMLDGQKEAPQGPGERNWIRAVFATALQELRAGGKDMTMSDLQALLWYPERRLYDAAKSDEDVTDGYEDDEAPDYANAAMNLALANGVSRADVDKAMDKAEARGTVKGTPLTEAEKQAMIEEFRAPPPQSVQLAFEVAPDPHNEELTAQWGELSLKERAQITKDVKDAVLQQISDLMGAKVAKTVGAIGGYAGLVNPNLITEYKVSKVSIEQARALAAAIGQALDQDSVAVVDPRASETHGLIRVTLSAKADKHAQRLFDMIHAAVPQVDGFTARGNNFDILNFRDSDGTAFSGMTDEEMAGKIDQALEDLEGVDFAVSYGDTRSELITKDNYEAITTEARPGSGEEIRGGIERARDRARSLVAEGIAAARTGRDGSGGRAAAGRRSAGAEAGRTEGGAEEVTRSTRRDFLIATAAALASPDAQADVTLGRAKPLGETVANARVTPEIEKILTGNGRGTTNIEGHKALRQAMDRIASTGPEPLRALAREIHKLLPSDTLMLSVEGKDMNAHGVVEFSPVVRMRLFDGPQKISQGLRYSTLMHESLHAAVLARYKTLNSGVVRDNDKVLGMSAPKAAAALEQFKNVFAEFRNMAVPELRGMDTSKGLGLSIEEAADSPDEFFVRALTQPELQAWMATKQYEGKTLLQRFVDWVKSSLLGFKREGTAPSWLDAALLASDDLLKAMGGDPSDFKRLRASQALNEKSRSQREAINSEDELTEIDPRETRQSKAREVTDTPEFKRWFGSSKMRDDNGDPKVYYHATPADFDEFVPGGPDPRMSGTAIWLSPYPEYQAAMHQIASRGQEFRSGTNVMPVYVRMERPLLIDDKTSLEWARDVFAGGSREFPQIITQRWADNIRKDREYDGIIFDGESLGWGENTSEVMVFDGKQIKSAIGNDGAFDPENPSITRSTPRPVFYSQLELSLEQVPDRLSTMSAPQWKLWLDANASKAGVKKDEIEWSGLPEYLKMRGKDKVSKDDLVAFVRDNGVQVKDVGMPLFSKVRQTETPEFKRWFKDSKVVDKATGEPLVVYHGTDRVVPGEAPYTSSALTTLDPAKSGGRTGNRYALPAVFFTDSAKNASGYAAFSREAALPDERYAGNVLPVHLSLQDPLEVDAKGGSFHGIIHESIKKAKRLRKDGVIIRNIVDSHSDLGEEVLATNYIAFSSEQIKSAIGNNGEFGETGDITRSTSRLDSIRDMSAGFGYKVADWMDSSKNVSWWDKSVGTPYHLAQKHPLFKRVFDGLQNSISDVSKYATRAADMAPSILPKLEHMKDLFKSPLSAEDVEKLADPIFKGTLTYTRDINGDVVEAETVGDAGIVWTDEELTKMWRLDERQRGLYREFRKATNKSIADLAITNMVRYAGDDAAGVRGRVLEQTNVKAAAELLADHLAMLAATDTKRADSLQNAARVIKQIADDARGLMAKGYAPLSRYGDYAVYAPGVGENGFFQMFETERDANRMARQLREAFPGEEVTTGTVAKEVHQLFKGITPETLTLFGDALGLEESASDQQSQVFQEYLRLAKSTRSALKHLIQRKGVEGYSNDVGRVLASFVYSNARQAAQNNNAAETTKALFDLKESKQGDLFDTAVRYSTYAQNPQEEAQTLRGLTFISFLGWNISSALSNATQSLTTTLPTLGMHFGIAKAGKAMTAALGTMKNGAGSDQDLEHAMKRAALDGVTDPNETHYIQGMAQGKGHLVTGDGTKLGDTLAKMSNGMSKLLFVSGKAFGLAEVMNRKIAFIAAYSLAREKGEADPYGFAKDIVAQTQFVSNKGNVGVWARGPVGAVVFQFKRFAVSYVENLVRMWGHGSSGKIAVAQSLAIMFLMAGLGGFPGADDLDDIIDGVMQRVFNKSFSSKQEKKEFFAKILGDAGADFVMSGVSGIPGMPIDVSGRLGMGNLIPGTGLFVVRENHARDVQEFAGAAGAMVGRALQGADALTRGDVGNAVEGVLPVAASNVVRMTDMITSGQYRDQKGRRVIDVTVPEAILKGIGFQPASVHNIQEATRIQQELIDLNKKRESEIVDLWAKGRIDKKPELVEDAKRQLKAWNVANPDSPISVDPGQVNSRVKQANMTKAQRLEKTAPKEIRASVKAALSQE